MPEIKFGTDGWRGMIARDFTFNNCKIAAQGIAAYMKGANSAQKGVVIGYDCRFMSEEFAMECAKVLLGNGIKVFLLPKPTPTPVTAYAVKMTQAGGAVMITASHASPEYNGIKFIPEYAGPAMPEITDAIELEIGRVQQGNKIYELDFAEAVQLDLFKKIEVDHAYIDHVIGLLHTDFFVNRKLKVVVNPMYGAGIGYLDRILTQLGCEVYAINNYRDVMFAASSPEPTGNNLRDLERAVVNTQADIGLALDGDGDRFGIIDNHGNYVSANDFMALLLDHLLKTRAFKGPIARTLATTHMLDRIAARHGLSCIETPVGFKYIGQCLREKGCLLGGEESGGLSVYGHIPEKDGILAGLLAVEIIAYSSQNFAELLFKLHNEYGSINNRRLDIKVKAEERLRVWDKIAAYNPKTVAGVKVERINDLEGVKLILADGSWFLIRASGTENMIRIYLEAADENKLGPIQQEILHAIGLVVQD